MRAASHAVVGPGMVLELYVDIAGSGPEAEVFDMADRVDLVAEDNILEVDKAYAVADMDAEGIDVANAAGAAGSVDRQDRAGGTDAAGEWVNSERALMQKSLVSGWEAP